MLIADACRIDLTAWVKHDAEADDRTTGGGTTLLSSAGTGLCGPGDADVTASQIAGQDRIFIDG